MAIDVERALSARLDPVEFAWAADDVIRYHLGLGAGSPVCDGPELSYVYEQRLETLATFAVVPASAACALAVLVPGLDYDPLRVVQGGHSLEVYGAVPVQGTSVNRARVAAVFDKGEFARVDIVVDTEVAGRALARSSFELLLLGKGNFGGSRGPRSEPGRPDREPDLHLDVITLPQQSALYRMSGDRAAMHIDPGAARLAGLPAPTLPGLCTWGMVAKAVTDRVLRPAGASLCGFSARFSGPVFPGETLDVSVWRGSGEHAFAARVLERDAPALSHGRVRFAPAGGDLSP